MSFSDVLKQRAKTASASNSGLSPFQQTLVSRGANAQDLFKANQERYTASLPNEITTTINPEAQQAARKFTNYKQAVQETQKQIAVAPLATAGNVSALASQVGVDKLAQYVSMDYGQLKQKQQELFNNKPVEPKHYGSWTPETTEQYLSAREQYNKDLASYNAERDLVSSLMSSKAAEYYNSALKNADFDTVSARGSKNADNPKYRPAVAFKAMTENFDDLATDDEKKLIDYYYGISTEKGNEYWNYLSPILEQRSASKLSSAVGQIDSKTVRGLVSSALSVAGGAEQFVAGLSNTVAQATGDSRVLNGVFSLANQQNIARVAESSKLGKIGLELLTSVVNTTPSVLIGAATGSPLLGAVTMGASASGNAYAQAIQTGSSPQEAAAYGLLNGASEAGLQYVLGGIGALGEGGLSGFLKTSAGKAVASKLDDVLKTVCKSPKVLAVLESAARYLGDAGSEALEEGLQEILDPILQQMVLNQNKNIDWSQVLESALLGALSAGVFNAASVVGNYRNSVLNAAQRAVQAPTTQETANDTSIPATGEIAPETPAQPTATAQTQETENTVTNIARTLKNTGKITDKEIRTIVESDANRAVFTQETGVELPAPAGDARRAIRAYQAKINTQTQTEQAPVVAPVNAEKTVQPQTTAQSETLQPTQTATQTAVTERSTTEKAPAATETDTFGKSVGAATTKVKPTKTERFLTKELNKAESKTKKAQKLVDYYRGQLRVTTKATADIKAVKELAQNTIADYESRADVDEISDRIAALYEHANGKNVDWSAIKEEAKSIAEDILRRSITINNDMAEQYSALIDYMKDTPVALSADFKKTIKDYKAFQSQYAKHFNINTKGTPVGEVYKYLSDTYHELFNGKATTEQAQLDEIFNVLTDLEPFGENIYDSAMGEASDMLADMLLGDTLMLPASKPTFADKKFAEKQAALQALRDQKNAKIDQLIKDQKQRIADLLTDQRKKRADLEAKYKDKLKQQKADVSEARIRATLRSKIKRGVKQLSSLLKSNSNTKHIPPDFVRVTADVLSTLDFTTDAQSTETVDKLKRVMDKYATIAKSNNTFISDPALEARLAQLSDVVHTVGAKRLSDMTNDELQVIADSVSFLKNSISSANKMFVSGVKATVQTEAEAFSKDMDAFNVRKHEGDNIIKKLLNVDQITPYDMFARLGDTAKGIYTNLRNSFNTYTFRIKDIIQYFRKAIDGIDATTWDGDKAEILDIELESGRTLRITPAQAMSIYNINKQEDGRRHLYDGGITPTTIKKKGVLHSTEIRYAEPLTLTETDVANIIKALTPEQTKVADAMTAFSKTASAWGNETSRIVYGYDKFTVDDYFTLYVDPKSRDVSIGGSEFKPALENWGSAKTRVNSGLPLSIDSAFNVFIKHAEGMARYSSYLASIKDAQRVFGYSDKTLNIPRKFDAVFGRNVWGYVDKFLSDVQGGNFSPYGKNGSELGERLIRGYKSAVMGLNIGVVVQQPTSVVRALALIDGKYLAKGAAKKDGFKKALEHSAIAQWKDWGYFDLDVGRSFKNLLFNKKTSTDTFMYFASKADEITWAKLWNACEAEVSDKTSLPKGSDAFYKKVTERFDEIIDRTQVVDTTFHRSQIQRSNNTFARMLTSFKSEPLKQYNLLLSTWKTAIQTKTTEARKAALRTTSACVLQTLTNAAVVTMITALLRDRDDNEEKTLKDYALDYAGEVFDNTIGMITYLGDAWSMYQGYTVGRMDMEALEPLVNAFQMTLSGQSTPYSIVKKTTEAVSVLTGVPAYSVWRDTENAVRKIIQGTNSDLAEYSYTKLIHDISAKSTGKYFYDVLYKAYSHGNMDDFEAIKSDMIKNGYTEESITSAVKSRAGGNVSAIYEGLTSAKGFKYASDAGIGYPANDEIAPAQESRYKALRGQYAKDVVSTLTRSTAYGHLDTKQQDAVVSSALTYASEMAERDIIGDRDTTAWVEKSIKAETHDINPYKYILAKQAISEASSKKRKRIDAENSDEKTALTWQEFYSALKALNLLTDDEIRYLHSIM